MCASVCDVCKHYRRQPVLIGRADPNHSGIASCDYTSQPIAAAAERVDRQTDPEGDTGSKADT